MSKYQPIQKILFGSPGTGKSYKIREIAENQLGMSIDQESRILKNTVKTVFHPEYTYADFMGKLLPLTQGGSINYTYYPGHFLRILGMAYRGLIENNGEHYLLVIDELNRGNAAAIFGNIFQLLDREDDHWSSYEVDISDMELVGLLNSMKYKTSVDGDGIINVEKQGTFDNWFSNKKRDNHLDHNGIKVLSLLQQNKIKIPPNFSIMATINTSDESIYYLDTAFKRRWDWEYVDIDINNIPEEIKNAELIIDDKKDWHWYICILGINQLIKDNQQSIRKIEDKLIGWWFIKPDQNNEITLSKFQDKVMFYLWDSVFNRDKRPLIEMLNEATDTEVELITYADFIKYTKEFIYSIIDSGTIIWNLHNNNTGLKIINKPKISQSIDPNGEWKF